MTDERLSVSRSDTLPLALVSPEATWKSMRYWKIRPSNMLVYRLEWIKNGVMESVESRGEQRVQAPTGLAHVTRLARKGHSARKDL